jgi:hypothetical protein
VAEAVDVDVPVVLTAPVVVVSTIVKNTQDCKLRRPNPRNVRI